MDRSLRFDEIDRTRDQVLVLVNRAAGAADRRAAVDELATELTRRGYAVQVSDDPGEVSAEAQTALGAGRLRCVLAAGGDGTAALLANSLPAAVPLALMPLGTENLLARFLGLSAEPGRVAQLIDDGCTARLDAGRANGRLFLVMASCGFDADVVRAVHRNRRGNIRHSTYAWPIWRSIWTYSYPALRLYYDEQAAPITARWAFVFNAPRYAMGLPIVETADLMDGQLDFCTFRGGSLLNGLMYLTGVLLRRHRHWRDTHIGRAMRVRIESNEPVPYQLDGDPGGDLPLTIDVLPARVTVLVPREWAERAGKRPSLTAAALN